MNALKKVNKLTVITLKYLHCVKHFLLELPDCYLNQLFKVKYELQLHQAKL